IVTQHAMALSKHSPQLRGKILWPGVLHLFRVPGRVALRYKWRRPKSLPREKEIRQLGVMHIVEERRVCHNKVHTPTAQPRRRGTPAGKIDRARDHRARGPVRLDPPSEGQAASKNAFATAPTVAIPARNLERRHAVLDSSQQPGLEQRRKRPGALGGAPHVPLNRNPLRLKDMMSEHVPDRPRAFSLVR